MQNNGFSEYAFVVTDEIAKAISKKLFNSSDEEFEKNKSIYIDRLKEELELNYETEFTGDAYSLNEDGKPDFFKENSYNCELLLYLPLKKPISLFEATYNGFDEIVEEIKGEIGDYLPKDFDYRQNIFFICGTYYG